MIYRVEHLDWGKPVVIIPKHICGWRVCVGYKPLNAVTRSNHYRLPFIDGIWDWVTRYEKYSVCDGYSGYFRISIAEDHVQDHIHYTMGLLMQEGTTIWIKECTSLVSEEY